MTIYIQPKSHPHHTYTKIATTIKQTITNTLPTPTTTHPNYHNWLETTYNTENLAHKLQHHISYITLINYQTIGSITLNPQTGEITALYITKQHWNKGIGKTLLNKTLHPDNLHKLQTNTIHITTNNHRIQKLLNNHNFTPTETKNHPTFQTPYTTHTLQLNK